MDTRTTFAKRFRELREEAGLKQSEIGDKLGVSRGAISFYENCDRNPDIEFVANAAQFFEVSADYLLGLTDAPTNDPYERAAVDSLGLSNGAVHYLMALNQVEEEMPSEYSCFERRKLLSYLFSRREFDVMLANCALYANRMRKGVDLEFAFTDEYAMCLDTLEAHGFSVTSKEQQASYIFDEKITHILRGLLSEYANSEEDE